MDDPAHVQVLIVGSGAGGAITALELARAGLTVCVLEEGSRWPLSHYGRGSLEAMRTLYRRRGMTPILGSVPIGYVEGMCVGGSTEINSGFWHRTPRDVLLRYKAQFDLQDASAAELLPHFEAIELLLGVTPRFGPLPKSTQVLARGAAAMGWGAEQVFRTAPGCEDTNACAMGCPKGAKQGMSRRVIPLAEAAGARLIANCSVELLLRDGDRITGVIAQVHRENGTRQRVRIGADHVFVCAGPTQGPALLRRSGVTNNVGNSLRIHPMLKVAAFFPERIDAQNSVLPLLQVKEFQPEISLGGAFFTPGHLAMILSDNWRDTRNQMARYRNAATYYVAVRGNGRGSVRPSRLGDGAPVVRYDLSQEDAINLSKGLARLARLLLAAGATEVHPSVHGLPTIRTEVEAIRWLDERLSRRSLSLTTVHAFSSSPMGERLDRCAADSFGKVRGCSNLYINDASMLPDSPGVNPQGSVMALARRNALHFKETLAS
jgi:choline dehydrogenase-like flavoprotein